jgi:hypothetical protein
MAIVSLNIVVSDERAEELSNLLCRSVRIGGLRKEFEQIKFDPGTEYGTIIEGRQPGEGCMVRNERRTTFPARPVRLCPPSTPVPQDLQIAMPDAAEVARFPQYAPPDNYHYGHKAEPHCKHCGSMDHDSAACDRPLHQ